MPNPDKLPNPGITGTVRRIYLTGFMGAGKSTVGPLLADILKWQYLDVDQQIEQQQGLPVSAIFEQRGEAVFRQIEAQAIAQALNLDHLVLSLGGGAIESPTVRDVIAEDPAGRMVYLEAPLPLLLQRCEQQGGLEMRPLLQDSEQILRRFEKRLTHYREAHLTVATQDSKPEEVAAAIYQYMAALT